MLSSWLPRWLRHTPIPAKHNLTVDAGMTVARSGDYRKARKSKRQPLLLELLENRLAPAVIVLDSVRTYDSREAIVDFDINTSTLTRPFDIQIFRSDVSFYSPTNPNNVPVGNPKAVTELSQGHHDNFTIDLSDLESGSPEAPLGPDPKLPYVLAVADPRRTLPASITIDNSQAHFRIYIIADVTQGFGPTKASWVSDMVGQLQAAKYDSVQRFDWNTLDPTPDETVKGGDALYDQLIAQANKLMVVKNVTPYDVIDVQLIGHSRGTAVVGRAMRDLTNMISTTPIPLARGYYKLTLLDPHPANSNTLNDIGTITTNLPIITYGVKLLALDVMEVYALLENAYKDPPIVVDHRVNQVEDYYQQNAPSSLSSRSIYDNPLEAVFNLLGDPSQVRIQDALDTITTEYNLTSLGLGHSDVWKWYMDNVIEAANPSDGPLANGAPPPWLGSSGGSSPPPSDLNLEQVLSQFVLDEGLAHELVNLLTTASDDLAQGNVEQSISDLESFDGTLRLAPDSDFLNGTFDLLQIGQNLIDDLGPVPSTSTGTIYWTGDAGRSATGDYNWDQPGNWSTVDPLVDNVRQEILPGPLNDVVVDLPGANIIHSDDIYDTISSLTVTDGGFINLNGGTLDLSGSGAPGIFHVPGTIIVSNFQYGNVHLNGGVLANADVTKETSILVFGSPTVEQAERLKGVIKGGVLNGTIVVGHAYRAILELEGSWVNNGTITSHFGKLILGDQLAAGVDDSVAASDAWVNNGTISTENTAVELGGWLSYDPSANNLATLDLSTDSVYLIGTLDNTGGALAFGPGVTSGTGSWDLYGGRIDGGTILFFGGSELLCTGGILDGVTNDGTIDVTNAVTFEGQWTNAGTITIANGATANLGGVFTSTCLATPPQTGAAEPHRSC